MLSRFSPIITVLVFLVFVSLAGCDQIFQPAASPTPIQALTQIAEARQALRQELMQAAPTLTALSLALAAPDTPAPTADAPSTPTVTPLPPEAATQTLVGQTAIPVEQPTATAGPPQLIKPAPPGEYLPSPTAVGQPGTVLFQDDFSSELGWYTIETDRYNLFFDRGGYQVSVMTKNSPIWSVRSNQFSDSRTEVDATQITGPTDGYYGLVCRFSDEGNYYMFVVSRDGAFGIAKIEDKDVRYLSFTNQFPELIKPIGNRLRADCVGNVLTLSVDGQKVLEARDNAFSEGASGLVVGNHSTSGTAVLFDNFSVLKP
jgi:hypothetical protein